MASPHKVYLPDKDEIAQRAAEVREGWSESDYERRWVLEGRVPFEVPECSVSGRRELEEDE